MFGVDFDEGWNGATIHIICHSWPLPSALLVESGRKQNVTI